MKQMFTLLLCLGTLLKFDRVAAQNLDNAGDYISAVASAHEDMNKKYMAYMSTAAHSGRARKIEKMRNQVLEAITNSRYKTTDLPIYKGDNSLRKSSLDYIKLCYDVFNEDYGKIVNMEEIAEQSYDEMEAYILLQEKTAEKVHQAADSMHKAEERFAAKYNVRLIDAEKSELSEKMSVAAGLNHYRNKVYLLFFKCNWQASVIDKAIKAKKVNDIEQARSALIRYADEGLKSLDTLKHFAGDASLAAACRRSLQYYKRYAQNDVPKLTDYYLKQENFEKMRKSFELKSERSKDDVNAYNAAVKDINQAVDSYNQLSDKINREQNEMLKDWEQTSREYGDTHMPRYKA